jgi:DNA-binding transcriptional MerR regulator
MDKYTISELANELDISNRTIRYYEERGLINPERTQSGVRRYSKKDRTVLKLILRGKKFGFSLEEIQEMLTLFDQDRTGKRQLERTIEYCIIKEVEITKRIEEVDELRREVREVLKDFRVKLEDLKSKDVKSDG